MLIKALERARKLALNGERLFCTPAFGRFLYNRVSKAEFLSDPGCLDDFARLDDHDVTASLKVWAAHPDKILSCLCKGLVDRKLFRIEIQPAPFGRERVDALKAASAEVLGIPQAEAEYFVFSGKLSNSAYRESSENIDILMKDGSLADIAEASDNFNIRALSRTVEKHFLCYPKQICFFP